MANEGFVIRLLGGFSVEQDGGVLLADGGARRKPIALVKLLALASDHTLSRDRVLLALWPDLPGESGATQLRKCRLYLKRAFSDAGGLADPTALSGDQLSLSSGMDTDVDLFRSAAQSALDRKTGAELFASALSYYRGDLLPDDPEDWADGARAELRAIYHRLLIESSHLHQSRGALDDAIDGFRRLVTSDPLNEEAHRALMRLFVQSGRRDLALHQYESCRDVVARELGAAVQPETVALHGQIVAGRAQHSQVAVSQRTIVGREHELAVLRDALDATLRGSGQVVLLVGDPGIGKTTIAEEIASYAALRGCSVAWGRSFDDTAAQGYAPWIQVLTATMRAHGGANPGAPSELEPLFARTRPGGSFEQPHESQRRLFGAIADYLRASAREKPLLIVLDDLHWADDDSLALLRSIARELRHDRVLVIGTMRQHEGTDAMRTHVHDLSREQHVQRLDVPGLTHDEMRDLVHAALDVPEAALLEALWERTRGNPLFVTEYLRLRSSGADSIRSVVPPEVAEVMRRRLAHLPDNARLLLSAAAVLGQEFELPLLAHITETPEVNILGVLDPAIEAGIIDEPRPAAVSARFSHPLLHRTAYEDTAVEQRAMLHLRAADRLREAYESGDESLLPQLAYQYTQAVSAPSAPAMALRYTELAGDRSLQRMAYEDAARLFGAALDIAARQPVDVARRGSLRLRLGRSHWGAGRADEAVKTYELALEDGRAARTPSTFGQAAIWLSGLTQSSWVVYESSIAQLEEALAMLGSEDSALRATVLGKLSEKKQLVTSSQECRALGEEAVSIARRLGDPQLLAHVLQSWHDVCLGPEDLEARLRVTDEMRQYAREAGDYSTLGASHVRRMPALLESGDVAAFDRELAALAKLAKDYQLRSNGRHAVVAMSTRALMRGKFDEAETLAKEALEAGQTAGDPDSASIFVGQILQIRYLQGRIGELEPLAPQFTRQAPDFTPWKAALALLYTDLGRESAARAAFEELAANDFGALPRDRFWLVSIGVLSAVCAYLGDRDRAETLLALAEPFEDRFGVTSFSQGCIGSMHRPLALLSATLGDADRSLVHSERALAANRAIGAAPWVVIGQCESAVTLRRRGARGDNDKALALAAESAAAAAELGMTKIAAVAGELRAELAALPA